MENNIINNTVSSFNIKDMKRNEVKKVNIDRYTYEEAERIAKEKIIAPKATEEESQINDKVLAECIVGETKSVKIIKNLIKQYLAESKKYTKEQIMQMVEPIYRNNFGLGAIDDLVQDKSINEVWVNGCEHIWIEKDGLKERLDRRFKNDDEVIRIMRQMLQFDRKDITQTNPIVESKMLDGSRITFVIPPASSRPYINIRKFEAFDVNEENILKTETINKEVLDYLKLLIKGRTNILIIGETSSGKTSFLKFLCDYINPKLRIGTIESNFELKLIKKYPDRNIFEFEEHEELGITLGKLFKTSLRSSPDIILLGEARGSEEVEELINSMRRAHPGSIGTIHTNNAETAIDDLVDMVLQDGKKRDTNELRHRIINAVEIIIQIHRFEDGKRKVVRITEVIPREKEYMGFYELNDIWSFDKTNQSFERTGSLENDKLLKKLSFYGLSEEEIKIVKGEV